MHPLTKVVVLVAVSLSMSAFADGEVNEEVNLGLGGKRAFMIKHVTRAAVDDPTLAMVTVEGDMVKLLAIRAGHFTLRIWTSTQPEPEVFPVTVGTQPEPQALPSPPARHIGRALKDNETISIGEALVRTSTDITRVAIGDPKVADVSVDATGFSVFGVGKGATTLILFLKDGSRQQFHLTVR